MHENETGTIYITDETSTYGTTMDRTLDALHSIAIGMTEALSGVKESSLMKMELAKDSRNDHRLKIKKTGIKKRSERRCLLRKP